ncbi:hypothetical protein Tco_0174728 [Tanacetum coccineum]
MPELEIFHKPETGIFDEASYDEEGVITDFNSLPTEIEVSPTPTLRIHSIHPKSQKTWRNLNKIAEALQETVGSSHARKLLQFYATTNKEVYVSQPPSFVNPDHPNKVYKGGQQLCIDCIQARLELGMLRVSTNIPKRSTG